MNVILEAIKFNHVPGSATVDAFNIRRNETEPVHVPEWRRGISVKPEDSPAAYARDEIAQNTITIKAKFTCSDTAVTSVWVRALDGHLNPLRSGNGGGFSRFALKLLRPFLRRALPVNVLGQVMMTKVPLKQGQSEFVLCKLADVKISEAGVSVSELIWRWQFSLDAHTWTDFAPPKLTKHRIYTVLSRPKAPWEPLSSDSANTQLPWTEVMDVACNWASATHVHDEAAAQVTRNLYELGATILEYDGLGSGSSHYTFPDTLNFDCSRFLERLRGEEGNGRFLNCTDCATVVSSFSNIVGCALWQSEMGYNFVTNPIQKIGPPSWIPDQFLFHDVAWKDGCTKDDPLFDACLRVDGDPDPTQQPPDKPLLAVNMRLGTPTEMQYHFRLAAPTPQGARCVARPLTRVHRIIGAPRLRTRIISRELLDTLVELYDFESWESFERSEEHLFIHKHLLSIAKISGWPPFRIRSWETEAGFPATFEAFWQGRKKDSGAVLRVSAYQCDSAAAAPAFLLRLLGGIQLTHMKRQESFTIEGQQALPIGDVAFAGPQESILLFARANFVILIRNVGSEPVRVTEFAYELDRLLKAKPDYQNSSGCREIKLFSIFPNGLKVDDQVPLTAVDPSPLEEVVSYRFFSSCGQVSVRNDQLFYRPALSGMQELTVFAVDTNDKTWVQELSLLVT
jgi:hypothetical protein